MTTTSARVSVNFAHVSPGRPMHEHSARLSAGYAEAVPFEEIKNRLSKAWSRTTKSGQIEALAERLLVLMPGAAWVRIETEEGTVTSERAITPETWTGELDAPACPECGMVLVRAGGPGLRCVNDRCGRVAEDVADGVAEDGP